jgi:hypothetical protein
MTDLTELKKTLDDLAPATRFVLDSRSDESILNDVYNYTKLIPFASSNSGASWADLFFMAGNSPEKLAQLQGNSDQADGTLLPHQAFLLAFLNLLKTPRALLNYFPAAHRELYYRGLLGVSEQGAEPDRVALSFQLNSATKERFLPAGTLFDAGQDQHGAAVRYALDQSLLVNQGTWTDLRWVQPGANNTQRSAAPYNQQSQLAWPQYGLRLFNTDAGEQVVITGRLVAAAMLAMPAGLRTIKVTFASDVDPGEKLTLAQVSSGDSWLDLTLPVAGPGTDLTFTLSADADAIAPPQNLDGITMDIPLLKLGRSDGAQLPGITGLVVSASGSNDVHYSTDYGVDRLDNLSYPFGTLPVVGSGFNLIAPGWCNQAESVTLTLTPQWIGLPDEGFASWYAGYDNAPADNKDFTVQPLLVSATGSQPLPAATTPQSLFKAGTGAPEPASLTVVLPPSLRTPLGDRSDPCDWPQWLRLELSGRDFGHQDYQALAGTKVLNPPYTPQMKALTVSYTVTAQTGDMTQYLLTPFGYAEDATPLDDPTQSQLYVGLTDGKPGETLSLYWQLRSPQALSPSWQYLNQDNQWNALDGTVADGTEGLLGSGLWSAVLPDDATNGAPQMPAGRYWLRALMAPPAATGDTDVSGYPWLVGIASNSMTATLNAPDTVGASHFLQPLPAGTVTRPVSAIAGIEKVAQPWPSTGGQPAETPAQFFSRVAQRLSHRERALTWQDMASLLKARYASVFDVAIPPADMITRLPTPTTQTLLVIPVNEKKDNQDPLRPKFSQAHLHDMSAYLQTLTTAWASIVLTNPSYRNVAITYDVRFNVNPDYGYRKLQELLALHYMPWAWDRQSGVTLGNILDYYGIIAWIQQQVFVEQVNALTLDGQTVSVQGGEQEVLVLTWAAPTLHSSERTQHE